MEWSFKQLSDWRAATGSVNRLKETNVKHAQKIKAKWVTPDAGCLKLNVDANIVPGSSSFAIGMILRDHSGQYLRGKVMKFEREVYVFEAEMVGIEDALSWILVKTEGKVCIESDSLLALAVQAVNEGSSNQFEIGHTIQACRLTLAARSNVSVQHVRRLANRAAYLMERIPYELNSYIDVMSPPCNVLESMMYDVLST
ncbi:uncharacterized protein LOC141692062 [Apium graveolens]|uniref:uncharacterized protein LOC141692062 n=1 Tax=Apium graveolens TaxID=4045 RepID=UPI003D7AA87A